MLAFKCENDKLKLELAKLKMFAEKDASKQDDEIASLNQYYKNEFKSQIK
jgi:hypothetical protein